jgi:luciferase family oxidoreductase group 1
MRLSILDAIQVPRGRHSSDALASSIELARAAERLGYTRYWIVEHHAVAFEANPAPEVFAVALAGATSRIRIGVGGVLLNHYSPYKVAEGLRTLNALFPGRIDAGIGRATAGPLPDQALRRLRTIDLPDDQHQQVEELVGWLGNDLAPTSPFHDIKIMRDEPPGPLPWILAVSEESAIRAAQLGLGLACSAFHVPDSAPTAMAAYRKNFRPARGAAGVQTPTSFIAVRLVIGETQEEAELLAMPMRAVFKLRRQDKIMIDHMPSVTEAIEIMGSCIQAETADWPMYVVGTPDRVAAVLRRMAEQTGVTEFMVQEFLDDPALRLRNYELLARAFRLDGENR